MTTHQQVITKNQSINNDQSDEEKKWIEEQIQRLNQKNIISLDHVKDLHIWLDKKRRARRSCRVIGSPRTGKTNACISYIHKISKNLSILPNTRIPTVPVVYIMPSDKATAKTFFAEIIQSLHYQAKKGTISDLRSRTMDILVQCQVEMLMIDEAQRLSYHKVFPEVKDIFDKLQISVVLIGIEDELNDALKKDQAIFDRFRSHRKFDKFTGDAFIKMVAIWEQNVLKMPVASNLISKDNIKILFKATDGYIGRLDDLLRETAIECLSLGYKRIETEILQNIANEMQ